jgi:hypothetical protein
MIQPILLILGLLLQSTGPATMPTTAATLPVATGDVPTLLLVVGAEGEAEYGRQFNSWADRWKDAAARRNAQLIEIGRSPASSEDADLKQLRSRLESMPRTGTAPLWIILIGHGTYDGKVAKFNLRGPDFSDQELADWLRPFTRPLAVIDCASSSAPFLNRLSGRNRVVITATKAGSEINFARFGDYISSAIADPTADLDKDGQTSLLEAFLAASHRTTEFYAQDMRLATEHAILDDNGDGMGIGSDFFEGLRATRAARNGAALDGPRARQWVLLLSADEQRMPADARSRRDELELQLESLRNKKSTMSENAYYAQLEPLLIELAKLYASVPATKPSTP